MAMQKMNKLMRRLFSYVVRRTVKNDFKFPAGGIIDKRVESCVKQLTSYYGSLSEVRIVDYCVCQLYRASCMSSLNQKRWKANHAFAPKAVDDFISRKEGVKYYEDCWLSDFNLTREQLVRYIDNRSVHPMAKFIYPEYEERTKRRALSTDAGYHICLLSTLLWTPLSKSCCACTNASKCKVRANQRFPELYRLRIESIQNREEMNDE